MGKYDVLDIARWFIWRNSLDVEDLKGDQLSLMKLLKLLYYAEGCSLALDNGSLFDNEIVAWEHGPVIKAVYEFYKKDPFNLPLDIEPIKLDDIITTKDQQLLEEVFSVFGAYSAWGLRNKTHEETPWLQATENGRVIGRKIDRNVIRDYFVANYI